MIISDNSVEFEEQDMSFAAKFGMTDAADMVLDYKAHNPNLPFIYDSYQLAAFFRTGRAILFDAVKNPETHYHTVEIPKKSGGARTLCVLDKRLKGMQRVILGKILVNMPVSKYATAYHFGARLYDNAAPHTGRRYLLKLDLSDFFGSIRFDAVLSRVFNSNYFPKHIGVMLANLCCRQDVLPQGAPTSPALSNLVMKRFDDYFGKWCLSRGLSYTRYCDDITVSGDVPLFHAYKKARRMLENDGFEINEAKTRFITNANRQTVTGLTVNDRVGVAADYKRKLRQEIYYARKFGLENVILRQNLTDFLRDGTADTENYRAHLLGKINFVLSVEPELEYFKKAVADLN